jgi:chromate reductase
MATSGRLQVLGLAGSLRRSSYNLRLLEAAAELAPPGTTLTIYHDLSSVPLFSEDLEEELGGTPPGALDLRHAVDVADGLLIATPEYNHSFPGVLKNALDWLSRPGPGDGLVGKPVALLGATTGAWGTRLAQSALRQVLVATESRVLPAPGLFVRDAAQLFDARGRLHDERTQAGLLELLTALERWIRHGR